MNISIQFKTIIDELKRLNAPTIILNEFQEFFTAFEKLSNKDIDIDFLYLLFYDDLKRINEKYLDDVAHVFNSKNENHDKVEVERETSRTNYIEAMNQIDVDYIQQKKDIEKKYQDEKQHLLNDIKSYENEKSKQDSSILRHIQDIKKQYETLVVSIEKTATSNIENVKHRYQEQIKKIQAIVIELKNIHHEKNLQHVQQREKESTSHDNDYIDIKSHYNILNITLNKQIHQLNLKKVQVLKLLEKNYDSLILPIDERVTHFSEQSKLLKKERMQLREKEIQQLQERKRIEIERYDGLKKKTIAQTAEAVSLLNSKLSNFRELTNEKKRQIVRDFQTQTLSANHATLQKNRKLIQHDNELNQFILKIRKDIKQKKDEGQLLLFELQKNHQILIADIEFLIKKEMYQTSFDMKQIDLQLKHDYDKLHDQKQRLIQEKLHYQEGIESAYLKDIFAFETQINLASQTQERDLGQLVLDASIEITQLDKNILEVQSKHDLVILKHQHQIEMLQFQLDQELIKIQNNKSQQLDQASRIRDLDLEESQLRLDLKQETFDEQTASYKNKLETLFIVYEKDVYHHEYRYEYQKESLKSTNDFKTTKRLIIINEFDNRFTLSRFQMDFHRSEQIIDTHVHQFYKLIQNIMSIHFETASLLMSCTQLLEQTFQHHEHPETMRQMIEVLHASLLTISSKQNSLSQAFKDDLSHAYEIHFENAKQAVLNMRQKDEHTLNFQYIANLQQEKTVFLKKKYEFEVLLKQSSTLKDASALKRIERLYAQTNSTILELEQKIDESSNQAQHSFDQFKAKFNLFIQKKFTHHNKMIKLLNKSEQYTNDFFNAISSQSQKLTQTLYYTHQVIFGMTKQTRKHYHKLIDIQQHQLPKLYTILLEYQHDMQVSLIAEKQSKLNLIEHTIRELEMKQTSLQLSLDQDQNFLRRSFRENIVAKKNQAEQKISNNHREFNEAKDKRLKSIQKLEAALQSFASKKTNILETLSLNQNVMLGQEKLRFDFQEQALKSHQQKAFETFDNNLMKKQNEYDEKMQQALNTIEQRLIKYLAFVEKLRTNFKDKIIDKTLHENKLRQSYKKRIYLSKQKTSKMLSFHKKEKRLHLILLDKHEKREQSVLNKKHQSIEFWVKKSYQFKLKSLDIL